VAPLERSRATLGQHHLNRRLRALNQEGAFRIAPDGLSRGRRSRQGLLLVDDILTTGATAMAAAAALKQAGYPVMGLLCLARTPAPGRDLRSSGAAKRLAGIAQLVEQATENRRVPSSNLGPGILL
jgi:orotate phosphoribosyltransferase